MRTIIVSLLVVVYCLLPCQGGSVYNGDGIGSGSGVNSGAPVVSFGINTGSDGSTAKSSSGSTATGSNGAAQSEFHPVNVAVSSGSASSSGSATGGSVDAVVPSSGVVSSSGSSATATTTSYGGVVKVNPVDEAELLARTILNVAFDKSFNGYDLIGWILFNRFNAPEFPKTYFDIVLQPGQFTYWSNFYGKPYTFIPKNPELYQFSDYQYAYKLAQNLIARRFPTFPVTFDISHGAKYFGLYSPVLLNRFPHGFRVGNAFCW